MHYEPNWRKSEICSGRLKSMDFDMESKHLSIIQYQGNKKECLKQVAVDDIVEMKFVIHHSTGREHSITYLDIIYHKNVRNGRIVVNLPWKYDKNVIAELQELANTFHIPFHIEKNTSSLIAFLVFVFIVTMISVMVNYYL